MVPNSLFSIEEVNEWAKDYLDRFDKDKEADWKIDENTSYVGRNGEIASMSCAVGTRKINLFVDVWNKTYAVLE